MKLTQLLAALPDYTVLRATSLEATSYEVTTQANRQFDLSIEITRLTADSRQVEPGALFVAYQGVNIDLHRFIPAAISKGAAAIVCENKKLIPSPLSPTSYYPLPTPYPVIPIILVPNGRQALAHLSAAWHNFPARYLTMIGVTGTDGKTTTTHLLYHILHATAKKVGMINTVSAVIGQEIIETGLHTTTPDAPALQQYLAQMVQADTECCVLEVTSHGLSQHRVTACDFDVAVVTNITHEHLDEHGSLENYRAAKASLFESLATAADKGHPKLAVLNCDDGSFEYLKTKLAISGTKWIGYSLAHHPEAAITAQNISYQPDKTCFTLHNGSEVINVHTTLVGDFNVSNCLAAATATLKGLGVSPEAVRQGIAALPGIPGRMERIDEGQSFVAIVDFAHTPNSLQRTLTTARTLTLGRVIAVFGCAGLRDVEKRTTMGHIAAELADITIITAEDPRTETLDLILETTAQAMRADGAIEGQTFERIPDRGRAIYRAVQLAQPGDVVIALGKGHEQSMCFGQTEYPWDDREAMRAALRGKPLLTLPTA
ncbi:MAG: UDP-N-acetylmuramoyl-L-alanyl-D-glutamate--2,6-diaminopimelate ligase [Anaerolineae bacterium]|nr:UDP-N-acetylmuramoyl-L-alanyl-D-glutamate--2,6-diaminopimelate ligase [Anaerolineae bacterium]